MTSYAALSIVAELSAIPDTVFHEIWCTHSGPATLGNGYDQTVDPLRLPSPKEGTRIRFVDLPPDRLEFLAHGASSMRQAFAQVGDARARWT